MLGHIRIAGQVGSTLLDIAVAALALIFVIALSVQTFVARGFRGRALRIAARLADASGAAEGAAPELPPIVEAFARRSGAMPDAQPPSVSFTQAAELRLKPGGAFQPFRAWQVVATRRAGFMWEARRDFGPFVAVRVVDALADGEGMLEARLLGSIPVASAKGPDVTLGEAFRYLAELPWVPDAIFANRDLRWAQTGDRTVEVALATPAGEARVTFGFDAAGDIVTMEAKGRPARDASGAAVRLDWRGSFGDYAQVGPRRIPATGAVGYVYSAGYEDYFRGRIVDYQLGD